MSTEQSNLEVRPHNGQCAYGEWVNAANEEVPAWVREYAETEAIESGSDDGRVEKGGSIWLYRAQ